MANDIFQKCYDFKEVEYFKSLNLYPYFRALESQQAPEVVMEGKRKIMLGSNNYLGLTTNKDVIKESIKATEKYGTGLSGSRFLNGTLSEHLLLEEEIAEFLQKESAMVFSTGFGANLGIISAIAGRHDYIICDKENHASIYAGCQLSYATLKRYNHSNMEELEKILQSLPENSGKIIITDGIFSMSGDYANLPEIVRLAKKYKARTMVDDAHALGVSGENGQGSAFHFGLQNDIDIFMGTFSKSLASLGGYCAASERVINFLKHTSRPFIFTASNPPSCVAAARSALKYLKEHKEIVNKVNEIGEYTRQCLKEKGIKMKVSQTPIIALPSKDRETTAAVCMELYENGVFVNCVFPPAVDPDDCLIRVSLMATFTHSLIDESVDIIYKVFKNNNLV